MVQVNLKELVGRLNPLTRSALEGAAGLCLSRTNYNVEIEHWMIKILESADGDLSAILHQFGIDASRVSSELTRAVDRFKTGNSRPPALSPSVVDLMRQAWLIASIDFQQPSIRSGHVLCALLDDESLRRSAVSSCPKLDAISSEALRKDLETTTAQTAESVEAREAVEESGPTERAGPGGSGKTPSLDQFTIDLTDRARRGEIDPVLCRDHEIRQMIDILTRRRQNNPILTGEAGVGKTAVVEGFALRLASGDVPESLRQVSVHTLDLGLLQAGAGIRGEFENRLKGVLTEVKASPKPIVLFIDEAHTMIGAGGGAGQGDAANLLKPALARGELRTIAATTWAEYKKYFEKDAALARRFQVIKVEEPSPSDAVTMLHGLLDTLEGHHHVRILDDALKDAVHLSSRYISGRQLPDKAISLLDTTCARIGLSQSTTPPQVEDCRRRITQLTTSIEILEREAATGAAHDDHLQELATERETAEQELNQLQEQWDQEKELVARIGKLRQQLEFQQEAPDDQEEDDGDAKQDAVETQPESPPAHDKGSSDPPAESPDDGATGDAAQADGESDGEPDLVPLTPEERESLQQELGELTIQLRTLQGETPLMHPCVDGQAVAETVAAWTGIPVGRMMADEIHTVLNLKELMEESIIGQTHALDRIGQSIRTSRANLADPRQPIGVFLLAGTSGVGKTETAITLANLLYGGEQNMTVLNMSEFKEEHKVSLLMGSPPGYVGYGEGGVLTEAVRRKPYSVLLLDEMEKAHPGVQDIFYQVFDKGSMRDGEGRDIDFKNTVIIMTTNAGTDLIMDLCSDSETAPDPDAFAEAVFPELLKTFKPAFLGRLTIVPYYPLASDVMKQIIRLKLKKIDRRIQAHYAAEFSYSPELVNQINERCTEVDTGARNVDHILTRTLLPEMAGEFLARMAEGADISKVHVTTGDEGQFVYEIG